MDELVDRALSPARPGLLLRSLRLLPGPRCTAEQIESFAGYWRREAMAALDGDRPVLVALGDSLAQGIGASSPDQGYVGRLRSAMSRTGEPLPVLNLSRSGARIADVLDTQLPALAASGVGAAVIVCTVGSNDLFRSARVGRQRRQVAGLLSALPDRTLLATVPDNGSMVAKSFNRYLRSQAERSEVTVADLADLLTCWRGLRADDRFHPNSDGHALWAEAFCAAAGPGTATAGRPRPL